MDSVTNQLLRISPPQPARSCLSCQSPLRPPNISRSDGASGTATLSTSNIRLRQFFFKQSDLTASLLWVNESAVAVAHTHSYTHTHTHAHVLKHKHIRHNRFEPLLPHIPPSCHNTPVARTVDPGGPVAFRILCEWRNGPKPGRGKLLSQQNLYVRAVACDITSPPRLCGI